MRYKALCTQDGILFINKGEYHAKVRALGTTITFNAKAIGGLTSIGESPPFRWIGRHHARIPQTGYRVWQGFKDSGEPCRSRLFNQDRPRARLNSVRIYGRQRLRRRHYLPDGHRRGHSTPTSSHLRWAQPTNSAVGFGATPAHHWRCDRRIKEAINAESKRLWARACSYLPTL